ncbi:proline dehydrogenase [Mesorhizobium sp. LNJC384A00]|nr:proline dehydrogenase [Mesorhizobium sp. LSJC264A00]ESY39218.1 proline dehydrogenase [Mesorhizobium sp. LNJC384A00]
MNILSYNPGHDGAVVYLKDARLMFSIESEKDSHYRNSQLSISHVLDSIGEIGELPDVICMGGWWPYDHHEYLFGSLRNSGYRGISTDQSIIQKGRFFKGKVDYFSSTHERSHILCAFGMSRIPKGTPFYALVWEGDIGAFYEVDAEFHITPLGDVLKQPGNRYGMLYGLADPTFPKDGPYPRATDAGKLMALASFSTRNQPTIEEKKLLRFLLDGQYRKLSDYENIDNAPHLNSGLDDPEFRNFAGIYSDAIFDVFHKFARANMKRGLPLVIAGGCGLNCDWNSKWVETGLFEEVFVPPVANDSGSAIGTAIDAQLHFTGNPKIGWDLYSGLAFQERGRFDASKYDVYNIDYTKIADLLAGGLILGWVNGRYEIGPRALGNRSILAAPFRDDTRVRLNEIKQREQFRPIAPVCLRDDAEAWFGCDHDSPYMLFTYRTTTDALAAVTHVNGTARIQTVTPVSNARLHDLLAAFKERTGFGVLCNTSLNFNGKGFINNIIDLNAYVTDHGLDGFVLEGKSYILKSSEHYQGYLRSSDRKPV